MHQEEDACPFSSANQVSNPSVRMSREDPGEDVGLTNRSSNVRFLQHSKIVSFREHGI